MEFHGRSDAAAMIDLDGALNDETGSMEETGYTIARTNRKRKYRSIAVSSLTIKSRVFRHLWSRKEFEVR